MILEFLQSGVAQHVAEKSAHMAEVDPHGVVLTVVSVSLVFLVLVILFVAYSISGKFFTRKKGSSSECAAAIAVALDNYLADNDEVAAAITVALHQYADEDSVHDWESGIITIRR